MVEAGGIVKAERPSPRAGAPSDRAPCVGLFILCGSIRGAGVDEAFP
jgi:hypothetical protein